MWRAFVCSLGDLNLKGILNKITRKEERNRMSILSAKALCVCGCGCG